MRVRPFVSLVLGAVLVAPLSLAGQFAGAVDSTATVAAPQEAATAAAAPAAAAAAPALRMPSEVPSKKTPWVTDGEVTKIVQIGNTMVAGGLFTSVTDPMNGTAYTRNNIFAFDSTTGLVSQTFTPSVDGQVQQLLPGPTPGTVYASGDFSNVNGVGASHLVLLNVNTGETVSTFRAAANNGGIQTMEMLSGNRLFIGGFFKKVGGINHVGLATLNATTGALDPYMNLQLSIQHNNTGTGVSGSLGARESGITPDGSRLVVIGNFKKVDDFARDQVAVIDLTTPTPTVVGDWNTLLYAPVCSPGAFDSYMRDVEMSPDGSYFVIAVTGGPHAGTLCDTATRWETYASGQALSPTWTANSGGDTLWGVGITDAAVFVGGHERWMNNPNGSDRAAQGAVPRPGIVALDPRTGVPLKWNPGRNPRGEAAYDIYPTATGVWLVSDTDWIGDRRYQRPRIAFFPYDSGYDVASTQAATLPGNVYVASPSSNQPVLFRVNAGGPTVSSTDSGPDWTADSASTSTFHNTGSSISTYATNVTSTTSAVPLGTPLSIFNAERYDPAGGNEMAWTIPIASGTPIQVRLYFANRCTCTQAVGQRRFNVSIDGAPKLTNYDIVSDSGASQRGTMRAFDVTSDGTVNINFTHVTDNPVVSAIEVVKTGSAPSDNNTSVGVVSYDGTAIGSNTVTTTANFDWTAVRGAFMVGRTLFYGQSDNMLYKRSFDGVNFGAPLQVDPYRDPLWATVETGSGAAGSTYVGMLPTWYSQLNSVTGMFYANSRLYYTLSGQNTLYWRYFVPDSGIVSPIQNTVTGGNITWSATKGMFVDGNKLYVVSSSNGALSRIDFVNGAPSGTSTVVNSTATGGIDWRGRALFLSSVFPNQAPAASFTSQCAGVTCSFNGTGSTDTDGTISSYAWDFGDGQTDGGATPTHDFPGSGTYAVTLTVTDDSGTTGSTSQQVTVTAANVAPAAAFTTSCDFLDCVFDASTSSDGDGTVDSYAWDFGDGATANGVSPSHTFAGPGDYEVEVAVTDDDGATGTVTHTVTVSSAPSNSTVQYRASAVTTGNVTTPNAVVPASTQVDDRLLMVLTVNAANRVRQAPTGVTGWTELATTTSGGMATTVYSKVAAAGDAGKRVTVTLDLAAKYTMTIAAYSGVRPTVPLLATFAETQSRTTHATPFVTAPAGAWVVSYWADKSSATTGFTLPASVSSRAALCGTSTGRICSVLADSNGAVPTGRYGGLVATADSANATAVTWSLVLRTQEPNVAPTAAFTRSCDGLTCAFNATGSGDVDGSVASYAWDFGDGGTGTGVTPSHDFPATGTYDVTLTVTDNEGQTGTVTTPVTVTRTNAAPTAVFSQTCTYVDCAFDASASADVDGTIQSYAWDFGDGSTDTGVSPSHTFAATGDYPVTLTVTDNDDGTATFTRTVHVVAAELIGFVGSADNTGNVRTPNSAVPAGITAGDRLVMVLNVNTSGRVLSDPTGVTGWTLLGTTTSGAMATTVYTKVAVAADVGKRVTVPMDAASKYTMSVVAYSGDMLAPTYGGAAETVSRATHTTPTLPAPAGAWVLSHWADKSSATTGFSLASGVAQRSAVCAASTGRVCSVLADSAGPVADGPQGGLAATADSAQSTATMWTLILRQDG